MRKALSVLFGIVAIVPLLTQSAFSQVRADGAPTSQASSSVSPGSDFYLFANSSGVLKRSSGASSTSQTNEEILNKQKVLSDAAAAMKAPKGSDEQLIGDFWFTGLDADTLNREGFTPLRPYLDRIYRINSIEDLLKVAADLNMDTRGDSFLFRSIVWRDDKNSERTVLHLYPGGISMDGHRLYSVDNANAEKIRMAFRTYLNKTFVRLYNDENTAQASANAVFELEAQMAKAFGDGTEYQLIGLAELSRLTPAVDWQRYFKNIGLKRTDALAMRSSAFFRNLDELLRNVPLSTWKDYLRFRLLKVNTAFLDDRALAEFFEYDRMYTGAARPRDRWQRVIRHMEARLGQPMTRRYLKEHDLKKVTAQYQAIGEQLRAAFRARIEKLDWMSARTKVHALKKLDAMLLTIGVRDNFRADFSTMEIKRDIYVLNVIRANRWLNEREIGSVGTRVDRTAPGLVGGMRGDGAYNPQNNEAILPLNFLVTSKELDDAFIYAKTGATLGHEMSHGFDSNGRYYDAVGNKADWWTESDAAAFDQRTKVLVELFNEFMPMERVRVNGQRTLGENLSDLTGLLVALDAFRQTEQFKRNEVVDGFTPLQRFFVAFGLRDRGGRLQTEQEIAVLLQSGVHSPDKERVNGALMNVPEFYEAFSIKPGDAMYRPEEKRARIW